LESQAVEARLHHGPEHAFDFPGDRGRGDDAQSGLIRSGVIFRAGLIHAIIMQQAFRTVNESTRQTASGTGEFRTGEQESKEGLCD